MRKISIVVDTNLWGDTEYLFNLIHERTKKNYNQIWEEFDSGLFTEDEQKKFKGAITFIERLLHLKNRSEVEIHVPSAVYNEKAFGISSKMSSAAVLVKNKKNQEQFDNLLSSIPKEIRTIIDRTELQIGKDYPQKVPERESQMKTFLNNQQTENEKLKQLVEYLSLANKPTETAVEERTKNLKKIVTDIQDKVKNWDNPISEVLKTGGTSYDTRTKVLDTLSNKIKEYPPLKALDFKDNTPGIMTTRLTMEKEEFDFFDLQIYLYAKEQNAYIATKNTQAYQEINDPRFLGYFQDIKIMNPLINFDSIQDLEKSGDLIDIVKRSIQRDFIDDIDRLRKFYDEKLTSPVFHESVKRTMKDIISEYSNSGEGLIDIIKDKPLGPALKILKFDNNHLKLSKKILFSVPWSESQINVLKFINKKFFENQISHSDFVIDADTFKPSKLSQVILMDGIYERLAEFLNDEGRNLKEFIMRFKGGDPAVKTYFTALYIESHFKKEQIEEQLKSVSSTSKALSFNKCPSKTGARKREIGKCLLTWEDIENVGEDRTERNPEKVKINSERFLEHLDTLTDPQQRIQLIQFADQVINSAGIDETKISGSMKFEVTHLINQHKVIDHFGKVGRVCGALNYGMAGKNILGDLLQGNIKGVAMNLGFIGTSGGLNKLAEVSLARGAKYIESGRLVLGNTFRLASPFIARLMSPLIVYDLCNQVKALNSGDKDAIVNIAGDIVYLGIDAIETGVLFAETLGVIAGISSVTGPIGLAIGAVVFIGTDIFSAVRQVNEIDKIIHLTTGERWEIGAKSFFHVSIPHYIEDLVQIKSANNKLAQQGLNFLKQNANIQRYVLPSAFLNPSTSQVELADDNEFTLQALDIKWDRARPDDLNGGSIFCAPQGDWENPPRGTNAKCHYAIGIVDSETKSENYTLFNLGDGNDFISGFKDSPNIIRIGRGKKNIIGGDKDDVFVLNQGLGVECLRRGRVHGMGGRNTLDFGGLSGDMINVNFRETPNGLVPVLSMHNSTTKTEFLNIQRLVGRKDAADSIYPVCNTEYIRGEGGTPTTPDHIIISDNGKECNHKKIIHLGPNTILENSALSGKFSYFINDVHSNITCRLLTPSITTSNSTENVQLQQNFFFKSTLFDIQKIRFLHDKDNYFDIDVYFDFMDEQGIFNQFTLDIVLGNKKKPTGRVDNIFFYLMDDTELRFHNDGLYGLLKSNISVHDTIEKYRHIGAKLGISLFILCESEGTTIMIGSDSRDDILYNDPRHKSYLIGNKGNNVFMVASGADTLSGLESAQISDIIIDTSGGLNYTNTLDLRPLSNQIKKDLEWIELRMVHFFQSEELVIRLLAVQSILKSGVLRPSGYSELTSIRFKNTPKVVQWDYWCENLHVILNNAPVVLNCSASYRKYFSYHSTNVRNYYTHIQNNDPSEYYNPLPLIFSGYEIIAIQEQDVERNTEIIVQRKLGKYRFLRYEDDLVLTNGFDFQVTAYQPCTIIFKNLYVDSNVFYTLTINYDDKKVSLNILRSVIDNARTLEEWFDKYNNKSNKISNPTVPRKIVKRDTSNELKNYNKYGEGKVISGIQTPSRLDGVGLIGPVAHSLVELCSEQFGYIRDYFSSFMSPTRLPNRREIHQPEVNNQNDFQFTDHRKIESKPSIDMTSKEIRSPTDFNSTLLLLDVIVRKLNDSKYKLPTEEFLMSPHETVEGKLMVLTKKLGLDPSDVVGSLEKKHRRMLMNMTDGD